MNLFLQQSSSIRQASQDDAGVIGGIFVRARDAMTYLPRIADGDRPKLGGWITARHEVWVVEGAGPVVGFAGLSKGWLDHLYAVSYTHLRAHETRHDLVCRLLLEKKK